jgi:hypothetical protein
MPSNWPDLVVLNRCLSQTATQVCTPPDAMTEDEQAVEIKLRLPPLFGLTDREEFCMGLTSLRLVRRPPLPSRCRFMSGGCNALRTPRHPATNPVGYSDARVANRNGSVLHGATENGP